jgi:lipoprotein signal peptidase
MTPPLPKMSTDSIPGAESPGGAPATESPPPARPPGERLGVPLGASLVPPDLQGPRPSYGFLVVLSLLTFASDIATKEWAAHHLDTYPGVTELWHGHLAFILARNRGGAWGLLQSTSESIRRPFFLLVSIAAITFIMTLYRRLQPRQTALKWGLPLVLGGALGNVFDRLRYGQVIDFIDAHWVIGGIDRHWPTFNVADIAICVGVGLMAIDMFGSKREDGGAPGPRIPLAQSGEPVPDWTPPDEKPPAAML